MSTRAILPLVVASLIQAAATTLSLNAGLTIGLCVGVYLTARLWFVDHPVTWRYDLAFWATLLGVAVVATALRAGLCSVLPIIGLTTRSCRTAHLEQVLWLHIWVIGGSAALLWLYARLKIWLGSRHR